MAKKSAKKPAPPKPLSAKKPVKPSRAVAKPKMPTLGGGLTGLGGTGM